MTTGIIKLYNNKGEMIRLRSYHSRGNRKAIKETWMKQFGNRYFEFYTVITPNTNERTYPNGMNFPLRKFAERKEDKSGLKFIDL